MSHYIKAPTVGCVHHKKTLAARCLVRVLLEGAQDAAASSLGTGNALPPHSVVRVSPRSAQRGARSRMEQNARAEERTGRGGILTRDRKCAAAAFRCARVAGE